MDASVGPGTVWGPVSWERMSAGIAYAVIGGSAVAAWVSRMDESVVRTTRDVDLLVRREDMAEITTALASAGFRHRSASILGGKGTIQMFMDGPGANARDGVRLIFAKEKVNDDSIEPSPDVLEVDEQPGSPGFRPPCAGVSRRCWMTRMVEA